MKKQEYIFLAFTTGIITVLHNLFSTSATLYNSSFIYPPLFKSLGSMRLGIRFGSHNPSYNKSKKNNTNQFSKKTGYITFSKINEYVLQEKKYMESDISLGSISEKFGISRGYLSQLINTHTKKSFNDYINELRIEASKKMLVDIYYDKYTIESIGLECGFNSKSNFYTTFKKFSGQTPNQFKKLQNRF